MSLFHVQAACRIALVPALAATALLVLPACGGTQVVRADPASDKDLSGDWNDGDSRRTAEAMISQVLTKSWLSDFTAANGKRPIVKLGKVTVRTQGNEVINTRIFLNDIRRAFINSGKVDMVAAVDEAAQAREERKDQDVNASADTRKESFQETGADFLLYGSIETQDDRSGNVARKFYQVDLVLTDIKTQRQVWTDTAKIAKDVKNARVR